MINIFCLFSPALLFAQIIPEQLRVFLADIEISKIKGRSADLTIENINPGLFKLESKWQVDEDVRQNDVSIHLKLAFIPNFHWAPHLTPTNHHIIAQHVFRSPALIAKNEEQSVTLVPDLDQFSKPNHPPMYLDMDAISNTMSIGFSRSKIDEHVLYKRDTGLVIKKGEVSITFYLRTDNNKNDNFNNPFRWPLDFFWKKWGTKLWANGEPLHQKNLEPYVEATYNWAFNLWRKPVWQEFILNGKKVGAPVFIVNVSQSPNYTGQINERETRSIWNQAWFSSLRSAAGLYRYGRRTNNAQYIKYALMTKELALQFPQRSGFFPSVIFTEMYDTTIDGKRFNRSKGWSTKKFGNSNRNPVTWNLEESPYHLLDMSFTALQMLNWYTDLQKDKRLLTYAINYANALIKKQQANGFFPGWLSLNDLQPLPVLNTGPETALSATFLLKLYNITNNKVYLKAASRAVNAVQKNIVPIGKWEDFETYWSCSRYGSDTLVGKKVKRNNMYKQNTLSVFYTAQALLEMYKTTKQNKYLNQGQIVLDELLMYQASWQPPYIAIRSLGGFGVMNADAEWNDSRQSLFASLILEYGKMLKSKEYIQRGEAAIHAAFTMMYHPLNKNTTQQWQARYPFFGKEDIGFMMENYGHDGVTNHTGLGIGEFTIYDWGNGAAAEAYNYALDQGLIK